MGASTSITSRVLNNTYVSFSEKDSWAVFLHEELIINNLSNFFGPIESIVHEFGLTSEQVAPTIKNIMSNSNTIIIYMTRESVYSYYQAIEINNAAQTNAKIIYIMTDKTYTPENTPFLKHFIENHDWFPAYDDETLDKTVEDLVALLKIK
jgi:hypothetical protein